MSERNKIALILIGTMTLGSFWLSVANEMNIEELRAEMSISDSLHYEAQEALADMAVTIAKYESYLALYGRGDTEAWVDSSDGLCAYPEAHSGGSWIKYVIFGAWVCGLAFLILFFKGAATLNKTYDEITDEYYGQDQ
jgi:hypothetical protein